jgi:hypothetical protein
MTLADERVTVAFGSHRLALVVGLAWLSPVAADLALEPAIAVGVAETDNLTLAPVNPERQTVYQLIPTLVLDQQSTRMTTDLSLTIEAYRYADRGESDVFQTMTADSELALDLDNFFIDFGASRNQSVLSPEDPIPQSNLPISTNRVDRDDYYFGPRLTYPVGTNGTVSGSYERNLTRYDEDGLTSQSVADYDIDTASVGVDNYRKERGLTWAVRYDTEKTDYGVFEPWEYRQATVELGAWVSSGLRVFAAGGKESAWDNPLDPSLEDNFWEVGVTRGIQDFVLEMAAGERTYGSSARAMIDYTFGRGRSQLRYEEQPTTERNDPSGAGGITLSDLLDGALDDLLERPSEAQRFLLNRLDWTLSFDLRRTEIALVLFDETREERFGLDGTQLEDESQQGGSIAVSWRLGTKTSLLVRADKSQREFGSGRRHDIEHVALGAERRLGARTTLALSLIRAEEAWESGGFSNYEADLISLLLARTF